MIDYIEIPVTNLDRAAAFYGALAGVNLARHSEPGIGTVAILPELGRGVTVVLVKVPRVTPAEGAAVLVYLAVPVTPELARTLVPKFHGRLVGLASNVPRLGSIQFVRDPDGNRIGLRLQSVDA